MREAWWEVGSLAQCWPCNYCPVNLWKWLASASASSGEPVNALGTPQRDSRFVLVTGATGFVGRNLVPSLVEGGFQVRAVVRGGRHVPHATETVTIDDIQTVGDWLPLLRDVDSIVHLAARAHRRVQVQRRERDLYFRTNVEATARLGEAARSAAVGRFIFVSTVAVLGSTTSGREPFSADDRPEPRTVYGHTKLAAEEALKKIAASSPDMMLDIVRPPMIVGPSAPGNLQILAAALRAGLPMPLASIKNRRMFLSIDSLVGFLAARLKHFEPGTNTFTLADPGSLSTPEIVRVLAEAIGVRPRLFPFPPALLGLLLRLAQRPDKADALTKSLEVDATSARRAGWNSATNAADGLRQFARQPRSDDSA